MAAARRVLRVDRCRRRLCFVGWWLGFVLVGLIAGTSAASGASFSAVAAAFSTPTRGRLPIGRTGRPSFALLDRRRRAALVGMRLHHATVYAPPWEEDNGCQDFGDDDGDDERSPPRLLPQVDERGHGPSPRYDSANLGALISRESAALLARLAVAFSPASRALALTDIENVQVLAVDGRHVDLQAVVCEDDGCVTLLVPVAFPQPCLVDDDVDSSEDEIDEGACVFDNLRRLDEQAQETIRAWEWNEIHHEDVAAQQRLRAALMEEIDIRDVEWPEWWAHPSHDATAATAAASSSSARELRRECDSIRKLLNDDEFRSAVQGMASQALAASSSSSVYDDCQVDDAAVAAVCSTGLLLRAAVRPIDDILGSSHGGSGSASGGDVHPHGAHVVEIPVRFLNSSSSPSISTPDELQSAVLALVAAAEMW